LIITRTIEGSLVGHFASDESNDASDANPSIAALANGNGMYPSSDRSPRTVYRELGMP